MCKCGTKKDQTADEVFNFLADNKADTLGIGLFLIPDPAAGILEYRAVSVGDISHKESSKRAENCIAFKFFPYGVELLSQEKVKIAVNTLEDLEKIYCGIGQCGGVPCYGRCFCSHWNGNCIRY